MRRVLAVARLELREWRVVPWAALAVGALLLVVRLASGFTLWVAVPLFGTVVALLAGAGIFARDLRQDRAAFLFARPLPIRTIWLGKLLAALTVTSAAVFPQLVALALDRDWTGVHAGELRDWTSSTVLLVFIGLWVALALSGRLTHVLLDLAITLGLFGTLFWLATALHFAGASWGRMGLVPDLWVVALVLAGIVAFAQGRGDRARSYAAFARTQWIVLGVSVLALAGVLFRVRNVRASVLRSALLEGVSPDGSWLRVAAPVPGRQALPSFLVSVGGQGFVNMGRGAFWETAGGHAFSADGQTCAWSVIATDGSGASVRVKGPGTYMRSLPVKMHSNEADAVPGIALSPRGEMLLLAVGDRRIEVVEQDDLYQMKVGADPADSFRHMWTRTEVDEAGFLDDETVWMLRRGSGGREFVRASAGSGEVQSVVALGPADESRLRVAPDGAHALALARRGTAWAVEQCDLHAGGCRLLWDGLPPGPRPGDVAEGAFLSDGSVVVAARLAPDAQNRATGEVRAFAADGTPRWTLPTALSRHAPILSGEPQRGLLFVLAPTFPRPDPAHGPDPMLLVVDAASGRVVREEDGLTPSRLDLRWDADFGRGRAATYFRTAAGGIVRVDPETWRREPIDFR